MKINVGAGSQVIYKAKTADESPSAVLLWGATGSGKTRTIAELIRRGETIIMLHFGLGLPGVKTIKSYLRTFYEQTKMQALIDERFRQVKISSATIFDDLTSKGLDWIENPILKDEPDFFSALTCLVVEEFNGAQGLYERDLVPTKGTIPRQTLTRKADESTGSDGSYGHYANLKMGTEYIVSQMLEIPLKHVWTCHENSNLQAVNKSGDLGPWIQTRAVIGFVGAFAYSIRTKVKRPIGKVAAGTPNGGYVYNYGFRESIFSKAQIENCPSEMPADPSKLWDMIYA